MECATGTGPILFDVAVILAMQCSAFTSFSNPEWLRTSGIMEVPDWFPNYETEIVRAKSCPISDCKIWPILVAPNRHAVYSKALGISRCFSLLCHFWKLPRFCAVVKLGRNEAVVGGSR